MAEPLNASGSRRACRMAISRNACSLPDFPEFAQAVRYGVPGTPAHELRMRAFQNELIERWAWGGQSLKFVERSSHEVRGTDLIHEGLYFFQ